MKRRTKEFKDPYVTKELYCSIVRPTLEYASVVWNSIGYTASARIESIQKQFLLFALRDLGWNNNTYVLPSYIARLKLINLETLEARRNMYDIMLAFDLLKQNIRSEDLFCKIRINSPTSYAVRRRNYLQVPFHSNNYTFKEPLTRVTRAFNSIADVYDTRISRSVFKRRLKNRV